MTSTDLEQAAREAAQARPKKEVLAFEHEGKRFWLKRGRRTGSNLLHRAAWRLSRLSLLTPVKRQAPRAALQHESRKLQRLKEQGIPVPEVYLVTDDFFVMEDAGESFNSVIKSGKLLPTEENYGLLFRHLGELHRTGEYHGGSQIRNFTYRDGHVCFIDFEENFAEGTPLETLQFRDLFLLLFSLAKDSHPVNYAAMADLYAETSDNGWARERLRHFAEKTAPLEKLIALPPLWRVLDKDTKATYRLIGELKKL